MSSPQLVSTDLYKIKKFLGGGSFGAVNLIKIKADGKFYALKEIHLKKIQKTSKSCLQQKRPIFVKKIFFTQNLENSQFYLKKS